MSDVFFMVDGKRFIADQLAPGEQVLLRRLAALSQNPAVVVFNDTTTALAETIRARVAAEQAIEDAHASK